MQTFFGITLIPLACAEFQSRDYYGQIKAVCKEGIARSSLIF